MLNTIERQPSSLCQKKRHGILRGRSSMAELMCLAHVILVRFQPSAHFYFLTISQYYNIFMSWHFIQKLNLSQKSSRSTRLLNPAIRRHAWIRARQAIVSTARFPNFASSAIITCCNCNQSDQATRLRHPSHLKPEGGLCEEPVPP